MSELLPQNQLDEFKAKANCADHPQELIVDLLRAIQTECGWVPDHGIDLVADVLGVLPVEVEEVATFYDKIYRYPVGKRVIHVCDSVCCWANGSEDVLDHLQKTLGINLGQTSADGLFTLLPTCCLGACGEAPAMMIGLTTYGPLTPERIDQVLAEIREEAGG
ncbi:MAG: NADH-quinone oxidoreductase subunit NuoE [Deltaproteobacteria bacterium]|jgi:NADH-quinone oxidoreductase subunit E|nr:NADH-quinone oxidoreductase subunit NuoE [Deltaproteobacteria bacterium]MBW2476195.1 NADH-quinone oxidoreductase subunit NuoE [Deltaproteobacteria bacterium]MBW2504862.1 NADH-quinone oxidoreductase subunit NuoE [Deltaproteobacteria bacterium]MBW2519522.1 NADH-quinone oxidoreductase subunit NuoE [Deltaproteobacteria bacterium]